MLAQCPRTMIVYEFTERNWLLFLAAQSHGKLPAPHDFGKPAGIIHEMPCDSTEATVILCDLADQVEKAAHARRRPLLDR